MRRRRIWSETVPLSVLRERRSLGLLRRFGLEVLVAVRPDALAAPDELRRTLDALGGEGIAAGVWPMLDDARGRWANARNAREFARFARAAVDALGARAPGELVVDLEPPIDEVRAVMRGPRGAGGARRMLAEIADDARLAAARAELAALADDLASRGVAVTAVAPPMVLLAPRWQALLGTPLDGPPWSGVNVMLYTSILEGWSRGLLRRADAVSVLSAGCRATAARFGGRGGVSLGAVGTGAFGDEPIYRSPAELARDVAVACACGVDDLTLFELGGVLARGPCEAWLEAFVETPPAAAPPRETLRARAASSFALAAGASLGGVARALSHIARVNAR